MVQELKLLNKTKHLQRLAFALLENLTSQMKQTDVSLRLQAKVPRRSQKLIRLLPYPFVLKKLRCLSHQCAAANYFCRAAYSTTKTMLTIANSATYFLENTVQ